MTQGQLMLMLNEINLQKNGAGTFGINIMIIG